MSNNIKVVCPTYKRAGRVTTIDNVSNVTLVVRAEEESLYRSSYSKADIDVLPVGISGLANTRQWIYEKYGNVFMLDDDISNVVRLYPMSRKMSLLKLSPDEAYELIQHSYNMSKLVDAYLFGFNRNPNPLIYFPFDPIKLTGIVNGCAFGIRESDKLFFDPRFTATEDFFISGLNAHFHRKTYIDQRFCFVQERTFMNNGGQAAYRTIETEKNDTLLLRKTFGQSVTLKGENYGGKGTSTKNKNPYGRVMKIPF
jgi:hypothetical protein